MFEILKRILTLDSDGNSLEAEMETVRDDGNSVRISRTHVLNRCPNCQRPTRASDKNEIKGICEFCRTTMTCTMCFHICAVCSKILCGRCAQGAWFVESKTSVVLCPEHFDHVSDRHDALEALAQEKAAFERMTMLELEKLRLLESPVMEGKVLGLVKKATALSMLGSIWRAQRQLRHDK